MAGRCSLALATGCSSSRVLWRPEDGGSILNAGQAKRKPHELSHRPGCVGWLRGRKQQRRALASFTASLGKLIMGLRGSQALAPPPVPAPVCTSVYFREC